MHRILCYGDSNTWGYDPALGTRLDDDKRWGGVLRLDLGAGYAVIEEGLGGRTTVWDDPIEGYKNGREYLIPCLDSHSPLDLVVIMLGTNDLKKRFSLSAFDVAQGAGVLVDTVRRSNAGRDWRAPKVLLIAPPAIVKLTDYADMFEGAEAKSLRFTEQFARVAREKDCPWLDAGQIIQSSPIDGIHFEAPEHRKLGEAVAARVREMLG